MISFLCKLLLAADSQGSMVADSLRDEPDAWTWDQFYAVHRSGIALWHANDDYGMHIVIDEQAKLDGRRWKPSWPERQLIYAEVKRHRQRERRTQRRAMRAKFEKAFSSEES